MFWGGYFKQERLSFSRFGKMKEFSDPRKIMLDIDRPEPISTWEINRVFHILGICPESIRYDRTRHGWHVVIMLPVALEKTAIVALQAILGSDPRRETLNLFRALSTVWDTFREERWNILFQYKQI